MGDMTKMELVSYLTSLRAICDGYDKTGFGRGPDLFDWEADRVEARLLEMIQKERDEDGH